jgi:Flp pilus assembly protein CpaB
MRASTIFALIVAVLLGLGAAVAIKYTGVLERKPEAAKVKTTPLILVAANNIYEGSFLQASDVKIRGARTEEELNAQSRGELLPAVTQAAVRRVAKVPIEADRAIRRDMLEDLSSPGSIADRIGPCDRGVHCCLNKLYCAGGLLQPNDFVDVHLTTTVEGAAGTQIGARTAEAVIARGARIAARRNSLLPKDTPMGPDCCINYTLSANPYRAALIEYAQNVGQLSLHPVGSIEKARLETEWKRKKEDAEAMRVKGDSSIVTVSAGDKNEAYIHPYCRTGDEAEDRKIAGILNGTYTVGEKDLLEVFGLKYEPPATPTSIERYVGVKQIGIQEFGGSQARALGAGASYGTDGDISVRTGIKSASYTTIGSGLRFRMPDGLCAPSTNTNTGLTTAPVVRRRG